MCDVSFEQIKKICIESIFVYLSENLRLFFNVPMMNSQFFNADKKRRILTKYNLIKKNKKTLVLTNKKRIKLLFHKSINK